MIELADCLEELIRFLKKRGLDPPSQEMQIVEISSDTRLDGAGRLRISRQELRTPSEYTPRFEELVNRELPWVNLTCYGVLDNFLLVGIEIPHEPYKTRHGLRPSVNYSGPAASVIQSNWRVGEVISVE
jgi:hypothetical protein